MAETRAAANRRIRQEALREQLAEQCRVQHVLENIQKVNDLAAIKVTDYESAEEYLAAVASAKDKASIIKIAMDGQFKLLNKYIPDLKQTELIGDPDNPVEHNHTATIEFIGVPASED